ncbi:hypothetical protein SNE40_016762 [Patella caerulea]|uniref:Uncharacterized protein n=1 Tax=Patella caerulea TaxID=87958 RepID=A0AAN8J948_PATCE
MLDSNSQKDRGLNGVWYCLFSVSVLCFVVNGKLYLRTDTTETIVNPHTYSYILNHPGACNTNTELGAIRNT